jgi:hypothetical protein
MLGQFRDQPQTRHEFLTAIGLGREAGTFSLEAHQMG